ncbi:hypothetical protein DM56_4478 [Burkholderia mallei]|nr:hypothetical protein DM75_3354 [Burkholderia mallei]KOS76055.1 hypothetical protein DM46_1959 [Burkholderia mallei]KOS81956.1 hypothetical protein DO61_4942 [Burkholderia mallei]KOS93083.1 hypothetical protein DM45_3108 [Burkholderia mallei]KOS96928.1 hypothetical protein DM49_3067 [Burkholderia mallei]
MRDAASHEYDRAAASPNRVASRGAAPPGFIAPRTLGAVRPDSLRVARDARRLPRETNPHVNRDSPHTPCAYTIATAATAVRSHAARA